MFCKVVSFLLEFNVFFSSHRSPYQVRDVEMLGTVHKIRLIYKSSILSTVSNLFFENPGTLTLI